MNYDNPIYITYTVTAASVATGATQLGFVGPSGKVGRVIAMGYVVTTAVTVAAGHVLVGVVADTDKYADMTVAVASADAVGNSFTDYTDDNGDSSTASNLIPADTLVEITTGSEATAGVVSATVTIAWF